MVKTKNKPADSVEVRERPIKSIAKTITWRVIASATTFGLTLLIFHDDPFATEKASGVAAVEVVVKMFLYFLHERAWNTVRWGKMRVYVRHYGMIRRRVIKRIMIPRKASND